MAECAEANVQKDKRQFERIDTETTVYLLLGGERAPMQVKLKNWSSAGVCATLEKGCLLPEEFRFYKPSPEGDGPHINCILMWQVGNEAGFKFSMKSKSAS
jgi:hypothetical protein